MVIISKTKYVTVLGGFHSFKKTTSFGSLKQCVKVALVFIFFQSKGLQEPFYVLDFSKEKKIGYQDWWFWAIWEPLVFLPVLKNLISNISIFFLAKLFSYIIFWQKNGLWIFFNNL